MKKILMLAGAVLGCSGAVLTAHHYRFLQTAHRVTGTVIAVEALPGPPKPREKIPLHVEYSIGGSTVRSVAQMPMLGTFAEGSQVPLWIDSQDQQRAMVASLASLFGRPLTYLAGGLVLFLVGLLYSSKSPPTSPMSSSAPAESSST